MKHPHCDVIVAWAEGKPIERFNSLLNQWREWPHGYPPGFSPDGQYRIKPKPRTAFQIYTEAAYPKVNLDWSPRVQEPIEAGLAAVINAVKSGELS